MSQYFEDWSASSVSDNPPAGWTKIWNTSQAWTVISDANGPAGKAVECAPSGTPSRSPIKWDAIDADADRDEIDIIALAQVTERGATSAASYGGLLARATGSAGSENGLAGQFGNRSGSATEDLRIAEYVAGSLSTYYDDVTNDAWAINTRYWIRLTLTGTTARLRLYAEGDPLGTPIADHTDTITVTGVGAAGLFAFSTTGTIRYLCVGVGTNGDLPPTASLDSTAPVLTSPTGTATGTTTATVGATTDEGNGTLYAVVTTSSTAPSASQIKAGQDHTGSAAVWDGSQAISTTGAKTLNATGLTASTSYYAHLVHTDAAANDSNVVSSAQFTTDSSDVTAPVLSSPTGTATGETTATVGATTDEGNGTLYAVVTTSATAPSVSQIKAGQDHTGSAAVWNGSQAISTTGAKTLNATGLTAATGYYAHLVHTDAATNDSNVVSSAQFTTDAVPVEGITIRLYNGSTARASETGLTVLWYDENDPHLWGAPDYATNAESTDASGDLTVDLSAITALSVGQAGFLFVYKRDGTDVKDSLLFAGEVAVMDIS